MKKMITSKRGRRFDEGGEVDDKSAGLAASNKEPSVGFFERLRMGNIDDPSSEAYKRFGAGRGRAERIPVADVTPTPVIRKQTPSEDAPDRGKTYQTGMPSNVSGSYYVNKNPDYRQSATEEMLNPESLGRQNESKKYDTQAPSDAGSSLGRLSPYTEKKKTAPKPKTPVKVEYDPTAGEAKDKKAQEAADAIGDMPAKPKAKVEPKKEMYRTMSGKMAEKTDYKNPMMGLGDLIGRGASAVGDSLSKYEFMSPAKRIAKENKEKKEARGYSSGGSVSKASSRADGIAQRGKTRGKMC